MRRSLYVPALVALAACGASQPTHSTPQGAQASTLEAGGEDGRTYRVASRDFHLTPDGDVEFPDGRDAVALALGEGPWQVARAQAADVTGDGVVDAVLVLEQDAGADDRGRVLLVVDAANGRAQAERVARSHRSLDAQGRVIEAQAERCSAEPPALPWTEPFALDCCRCSRRCDWDELDPNEETDCRLEASTRRVSYTPPGAREPLVVGDGGDSAPACACD